VNKLTDRELIALAHDWQGLFARPEQRIPEGDWTYWLIKAGRGYGKTRTGAETVRQWVADGHQFVNLVGATADDARDIMIEGESGILAICPEWERPEYKPSQRKLIWPNGATSLIFTADEPERLRGKQHSKMWCLTGDTLILMDDGTQRPLRDVRAGDCVQTRKGPRGVVAQALTKRDAVIYSLKTMGGRVILGTAEHPVFVPGQGFIPIGQLEQGMPVCVTHVSSGAARFGIATTASTIKRWSTCIEKCGKRLMGRYRAGFTYITRITTSATTGSKTSNCYRIATIRDGMSMRTLAQAERAQSRTHTQQWRGIVSCAARRFTSALFATAHTIAPQSTRLGFAPAGAWNQQGQTLSQATTDCVSTAEPATQRHVECSGFAPNDATRTQRKRAQQPWRFVTWLARIAERFSRASALTRASVADHAPCITTDYIAAVERLATCADVYDIAVDGEREFFANGILVHNCDELAAWRYPDAWTQANFGLRLGSLPQAVITTTPRPTKLIREIMADPGTLVTHGSTYDNRDNLAPSFFSAVIRRYEGTRLGRQELSGEVLDDNPGALFKRTDIEAARMAVAPELSRVVVAIDPAATSTEGSDDTGIVLAGIAKLDGVVHGYILADLTCHATPEGWARVAVKAYKEAKADRIIAEVNNGGEMVESVIRAVDSNVPVRKVTATRGKAIRAEPVAALYEQGRIHHIGDLGKLEDQMVGWDPADKTAKSPDRLDAMVWAITELMLGNKNDAYIEGFARIIERDRENMANGR
jgi:phage terminase large subunit-like protein